MNTKIQSILFGQPCTTLQFHASHFLWACHRLDVTEIPQSNMIMLKSYGIHVHKGIES